MAKQEGGKSRNRVWSPVKGEAMNKVLALVWSRDQGSTSVPTISLLPLPLTAWEG
jgi:hypothetical protein